MPFSYEQLRLGAHPFSLKREERKKRKQSLEEQLALVDAELQTSKDKQIEEKAVKRLKHQKHLLSQRMQLIDTVNAGEDNLRREQELTSFASDVTFSPQLKAALIKYGQAFEVCAGIGKQVAAKYGVSQTTVTSNGLSGANASDLRDFADMVGLTLEMSEEEIREKAAEFGEDYLCGDPELRKARLDEFYDRIDGIDPLNLDLSCLFGKDHGARSGSTQLTASEQDFLKLITLVRTNQALQTKEFENPEYIKERYSTDASRYRFDLTQDLLITHGVMSYIVQDVLLNNQLRNNLTEIPTRLAGEVEPEHERGIGVQIAFQVYKQNMAVLTGQTCDPTIRFRIPEPAADGVYRYGKPSDGAFSPSPYLFNSTMDILYSSKPAQKAMQEAGLEIEDMIFIDGVSVKEIFTREHPELQEKSQEYKAKAYKDIAMKAILSGEHRVECATLQMNEKGTYSMQVSSVQPDLHALDKLERSNEHKKRGLFGWLKNQPTRADRIDQLWANDPEREVRQNKIRDQVNQKIMASINQKEKAKYEEKLAKKDLTPEKKQRIAEHNFMQASISSWKEKVTGQNEVYWSLVNKKEVFADTRLGNLGRPETCFALMGLYGMSLEGEERLTFGEIMSDDPNLNAKKAAVGKKFTDQLKIMNKDEYAEKGLTLSYDAYVNKRCNEIVPLFHKMYQKMTEIQIPLANTTDANELAKHYQEYEFIAQGMTEVLQVAGKFATQDNMEAIRDIAQNLDKGDYLKNLTGYCEFVASDAYLGEIKTDINSELEIVAAYVSRTELEEKAPIVQDVNTVGDMFQKLGRIDRDKPVQIKTALRMAFAAESTVWKDQVVEYAITGKNPMHVYDPKAIHCQVLPAHDEVFDFETFDLSTDGTVDEKSVRTSSWKELEREEKKAKAAEKQQEKKTVEKVREKAKEKSEGKKEDEKKADQKPAKKKVEPKLEKSGK